MKTLMETNYRERLARMVLVLIILTMVGGACWYLRSILAYIALALVVTVLSLPFRRLFDKIRIGKFHCPDYLSAILSILSVFTLMMSLVTIVAPLMNDVTKEITMANITEASKAISEPLSSLNEWIRSIVPNAGPEFKVEHVMLGKVQALMDTKVISSVVGGVTSFIVNIGVTLFAVLFMAFFFVKTPAIIEKSILALVPDAAEERMSKSVHEILTLITRYFTGVTIEVAAVWMVNFIGLWAVAGMGFKYSLSIAFLAGMLNIVPYIGPLIGGVLGVSVSLLIHYTSAGMYGLNIDLIPFVLVLVGIFTFAQLIDNYILQPVIYSNSVKAHPLEIFIVFLVAGQMGGMTGMLVAVPAYTVIRVIAREFLGSVKAVRKLTQE